MLLAAPTPAKSPRPSLKCQDARAAVKFYAAATHRWERQQGAPLTGEARALSSPSCWYVHWAAVQWQARARSARRSFAVWFTAESKKWGCIHDHESHNWAIHDPPYDGGLQMDARFQSDYGSEFISRWGSAGHWPVWAQYIAADRAFHGYRHGRDIYRARGYGPWPNTAVTCRLT